MKSASFPNYFSEKLVSIDKIPAILQVFKVVIFCPTTEHSGIWVGLLVTSSKSSQKNTQETFEWVSSAVGEKIFWGICASYFIIKWARLLNERTESSSNTIRSLATISRPLQVTNDNLPAHLANLFITEPLIVHNDESIFFR